MKKNIFCSLLITTVVISVLSTKAYALTFTLPSNGDSVVGKVQWTQSRPGDNFTLLGRRYDVGYYELVEANPGVNPALPKPGTIVIVPTRFIIPNVPRVGIVLNLAELRLYYFPPGTNKVITFPVGVGREGWNTPLGVTMITAKIVNPTWIPPKDIIKWHKATFGNELPAKVPPGPNNPLGGYEMRLGPGFPEVRIHGTNDAGTIGRRCSSGCVHLWAEDVEELFSRVKIGTPVRVMNDPYKAGWLDGKVYLESHVPLETNSVYNTDLAPMRYDIQAITANHPADIDWDVANRVAQQQNGIAQVVGVAK